ncbi:MAG: hypothetical protein C0505_19365 [Leptothrix sp. (in: Bacteria)]|nr:hypothetical protein [Leptothrix sp. (in: b-proteobacteria)]
MPAVASSPSPSHRPPLRHAAALCTLWLAGCGAEVAGTAAAVGKLQAEKASQAMAQHKQIVEGMKQAQDAGLQRAADAAASAGQ